ncbi:cortistatin [Apodemus sylvaticus]|uniref:cortistatin n=1 Tax=Apodemus sylvaticus TaxID=10129 RepID=UPI0022432A8F|nr:cortistatin [Apodemus sylvaticus]
MGGCSARDKWPPAIGLLLLLWVAAAPALPLESGPTGQDSVPDATEGRRSGLLTFLAWWHEWASQADPGTPELSAQQERPPLQQPPHRDKKPCKNFFWKTFSCK